MWLTNSTQSRSSSKAAIAAFILALAFPVSGCARDPHVKMLAYAQSGDAYATAGKLPEAVIEYRNAVQLEPRAADVRLKLAEIYLRQGEAAKALDEYVRAADVLPDAGVQLKAGSLLLAARRFDDAKYRAQRALADNPKNVDAQVLLANALAGLRDLDGAVTELQQAIQLEPDRSATYSNLGAIELGRGRRDEAERAFARAVELAPRSGAAHLGLASLYWANSQWDAAEKALLEALRVDPDNALAHRATATFYLLTNRRDQAESHLRRNLELSKSTDAAVALADYYVSQNNHSAAREVLQGLANDASAIASTRLAVLDEVDGHTSDARQRIDTVLSTDATQLSALLVKTGFLLADGKLEEAVQTAKNAVDAHPDSSAAYSALGRAEATRKDLAAAASAYRQAVRLNPLATDAKLALARLELASGRADSSAGLAQEALSAEPNNADARLLLVRAFIARGDTARAKTELETLAARYPHSAAISIQRGILYGREHKIPEARRELERALTLEPSSLEATGALIALDLSTRNADGARARVEALLRRPEVSAPGLMLAARTYSATGATATSEQLLRRILEKDPSYLSAYAALGQLYAKQGRLDAALNEFENMARRDSKPIAALTFTGLILEAQGKTSAAQERFERVLQLDSSAPVAANNLAWIYAQSDSKLDAALELAQTARRSLQNVPEVADTLGFIYYKKGLWDQAVRELSSAVSAEDTNPAFHYHLGLALSKRGDTSAAAQHLSRALTLNPDFEGSSDAKALLVTLGS